MPKVWFFMVSMSKFSTTSTSAFYERATMDLSALRKQAESLQGQLSSGARLRISVSSSCWAVAGVGAVVND